MSDLKPDALYVVYSGKRRYSLADRTEAVSVGELYCTLISVVAKLSEGGHNQNMTSPEATSSVAQKAARGIYPPPEVIRRTQQ